MDSILDRLTEEHKKWSQDTPNRFSANPAKNIDASLNLFIWHCEVPGPRKTPWSENIYKFTIEFDKMNLHGHLKITCTSKVFHPNIDDKGFVCSNLCSYWPECVLKQILFCLQSFLEDPNLDSPLNYEATRLYIDDRQKYNETVKNLKGDLELKINV